MSNEADPSPDGSHTYDTTGNWIRMGYKMRDIHYQLEELMRMSGWKP